MADKIEVRFDERWKEGPRSKGGIAYILDPKSGDITILGYKDGQIVSTIETNLEEVELFFDQALEAYNTANDIQLVEVAGDE